MQQNTEQNKTIKGTETYPPELNERQNGFTHSHWSTWRFREKGEQICERVASVSQTLVLLWFKKVNSRVSRDNFVKNIN